MEITIEGKTIVILGGTSGVGKKMVEVCAKEGADVIFGGRNQECSEEILWAVADYPGKAYFVRTDAVIPEDCEKLFHTAMGIYGKVDGFFHYAGITPVASLDTCDVETLDKVMDVNFRSAFLCCRHAIRCMRQNGGGSIILTGSPHAWGGDKDRAAYACSKGALLTLMNHIAHNYACENIRCNYLTMGWTLTEGEIALRKSLVDDVGHYFKEMAESIPMKRFCVPDDYTEQIVYLFSDASKMTTGTVLQMTAGYFL